METIQGSTTNADRDKHLVVIYSRTDVWYVQPYAAAPFTELRADGSWRTNIHLGDEYAALLVDKSFKPPLTAPVLPGVGNGVIAVARAAAR